MKLINSLLLIVPLVFSGCNFVKIKDEAPVVEKIEYTQEAKDIATSMHDVSNDDAKLMYSQFAGLYQYMLKTGKITDTRQLNKIFESFQKDYGYSREKYPTYTDKVSELFILKGLKNPKTIVVKPESEIQNDSEVSRTKVLELIKNLGDGAKIVMETKVDA